MNLSVEGVTEEEYGLWRNDSTLTKIPMLLSKPYIVVNMGFDLELTKNFDLDLTGSHYLVFVKVSNNKEYDIYREHLITLVKMLILSKKNEQFDVDIFIVSAKHDDYRNELWSFFNMSNSYTRVAHLGERGAILKNICMGYLGVKKTESLLKLYGWLGKTFLGSKEE